MLLDIIEKAASVAVGIGAIGGGLWGIQRMILGIYDHVNDVRQLKRSNAKSATVIKRLKEDRKEDKARTNLIIEKLDENSEAIANNDLKTDDLVTMVQQTRTEVIKIAIKANVTSPDFNS